MAARPIGLCYENGRSRRSFRSVGIRSPIGCVRDRRVGGRPVSMPGTTSDVTRWSGVTTAASSSGRWPRGMTSWGCTGRPPTTSSRPSTGSAPHQTNHDTTRRTHPSQDSAGHAVRVRPDPAVAEARPSPRLCSGQGSAEDRDPAPAEARLWSDSTKARAPPRTCSTKGSTKAGLAEIGVRPGWVWLRVRVRAGRRGGGGRRCGGGVAIRLDSGGLGWCAGAGRPRLARMSVLRRPV